MKAICCAAVGLAGLFHLELGLAQTNPPSIVWQRSFGGTGNDVPYQVRLTADGGLLLGGSSSSTNGTRTNATFGGDDFWLVRLDETGTVLWERSFGGVGTDQVYGMEITSNNKVILVGGSDSPVSGNKTAANFGARDFWVVLVDQNGQKLWDRSFGGTDDDYATCVAETPDGGFFVAGYSRSGVGGNKTAPARGEGDVWLVQLDSQGNKVADWSYGGTGDDGAFNLVSLSAGSLVIAANSTSAADGNKTTPNYGGYDLWLLRVSTNGAVEWERNYGGDNDDGYYSVSLRRTPDGGFVIGADSFSGASGNKTSPNYGLDDYWILRLDSLGSRLWETNCGGTDDDYLTSLVVTPEGRVIAGGGSNSGVSGNRASAGFGSTDFWLVQLETNGVVLWDKAIGGTSEDAFFSLSLALAPNGALFCGGDSLSGIGGNKTTAALGLYDYWLVKLSGATRPSLRINLVAGAPQVVLQGDVGRTYVTEASLDFQTWAPVSTNQLTQAEQVIPDPGSAGKSQRFYRARLVP